MLRRLSTLMLGMLVAGLCAVGGCRERPAAKSSQAAPGADAAAPSAPGAAAPRRIVSLSPAITSALLEFGVGAEVVGRTPWCEGVDSTIPVVGDATSVDVERLLALAPTHVLLQSTKSGEDLGLTELARERGWVLRAWRLDRFDDVVAMMAELGETLGGDAERTSATLRAALEKQCQPQPAITRLGKTVLLFGADPPSAFGPGSYVDDIWTRLAGRNAVTRGAYPELSVEDLIALDPDSVVVIGSDRLMEKARTLPFGLRPHARLYHTSGEGLLQPGARLSRGIDSLVEAIRAGAAAP